MIWAPNAQRIWQDKFPDIEASPPDKAKIWLVENEPIAPPENVDWVQFMGTGMDSVLEESELPDGIILTNASGVSAIPIAEYVLASMLSITRRFRELDARQKAYSWDSGWVFEELAGKTASIIGYGSIGREVARLCSAFKMTTLACKRNPGIWVDAGWCVPGRGDPKAEIPQRVVGPRQAHEIIAAADYLVICAPLTKETHGMIGAREIAALKPSAVVINVGRGAIVDQQALVTHLVRNYPEAAAASLDVFHEEPLPDSSPLWDMGNVIISPHCCDTSQAYMSRLSELFCENLGRYFKDIPLLNVVNAKEGY